MANPTQQRVRFFSETLGLSPLPLRLKQAGLAIFGEADVPRSKFDLSSLSNVVPKVGLPLWMGKQVIPRKVIVSNLFNHTQTPVENGWSVKKTQVLDFRKKQLTYDSHNGTDFCVPIGSTVLAAAPGRVMSIRSEFNRGGLKIGIDHGDGLITVSVHLARSLVKLGDRVNRSQPIAISGYSGLDGLITFPFGLPHIHFNTWLNGIPVDPFGLGKSVSMWNGNDLPKPNESEGREDLEHESFKPTPFDPAILDEVIDSCKTLAVKEKLRSISDLEFRAIETIFERNYYPTRFTNHQSIYTQVYDRTPRLDLPFSIKHFDGVVFLDDYLRNRSRD